MTKANSEYHAGAIRDVRARYGKADLQQDPEMLKRACALLQKYATDAPEPDRLTSARDLLDTDARSTCSKWHQLQEQVDANRFLADTERLFALGDTDQFDFHINSLT